MMTMVFELQANATTGFQPEGPSPYRMRVVTYDDWCQSQTAGIYIPVTNHGCMDALQLGKAVLHMCFEVQAAVQKQQREQHGGMLPQEKP